MKTISMNLADNLYGLDIDDRAAQMAYFVVMMKGCHYDSRFLRRHLNPHVYAIQESGELTTDALGRLGKQESTARALLDGFKNAKEYGSILQPKVTLAELDALQEQLREVDGASDMGSFTDQFVAGQLLRVLCPLVEQARMLVQKYDVVVTNPPYMGGSGMDARLSDYVKKVYPDSKSDLFAVFIEHGNEMVKRAGFNCMVTMQSWMFLSSFEKMRVNALQTKTITNLMHMENMVMGIAFGTAVAVFQNVAVHGYKGTYNQIKLQDIENDVPKQFPVSGNRFAQVSTDNFSKIPGSPVAYWASEKTLALYGQKCVKNLGDSRKGMATGCNDIFVRNWYETEIHKIGFGYDRETASKSGKKWFPYANGGSYRKWYGNNLDVVLWEDDGYRLQSEKVEDGSRLRAVNLNLGYIFKSGIVWNSITSSKNSFRVLNEGYLFSSASNAWFGCHENYVLAFLNTNVCTELLKIKNPTLNANPGDIAALPICICKEEQIERLAIDCENESKIDWDSFETSWDFKRHPLV